MSLTVFEHLEQRSEKWHEVRRGILTASVIGQLVTPSTLKVAENDASRALTALLAAERITGHTDPTWQSADMFRGVIEEPIARDLYSEHYAPVKECGFILRDLGVGVLGLSPDGLVGDDGLIEVKSRRQKKQVTTVLSGRVPPENLAQCQAALLVSGRAWLDYLSFSNGMHLWVTRVYPDIKWFEAITAAVAKFEETATRMTSDYLAAVDGFPLAERVDYDLEVVV